MKIEELNLNPNLLKALNDLGFTEFTQIQEKCIPVILEGKDIFGHSSTGSGKTAAFGLPIFEKLECGKGIQALVLTPTRELCVQVTEALRSFAKFLHTKVASVYGGVGIEPQIEAVKKADIVVGTPGRILDHINRKTIHLNNVKFFVLDEADKMFEMGFIDDVKNIISRVPRNSQKLLFSATMPSEILHIVKDYMNNPEKIKMKAYVDTAKLAQYYYDIDRKDKFSLLMHTIKKDANGLVIIFCGTRHAVDIVNTNINKQKIKSLALHGGITQNKRNQTVDLFHQGKLDVLVASDVAARGLDIKNVNLIINYDIPKTSKEYVHRIGRTARAGNEGKVISFLSQEDHENFRRVIADRSLSISKLKTPEFERLEFVRPQFNRRPVHGRFQSNRKHRFIHR